MVVQVLNSVADVKCGRCRALACSRACKCCHRSLMSAPTRNAANHRRTPGTACCMKLRGCQNVCLGGITAMQRPADSLPASLAHMTCDDRTGTISMNLHGMCSNTRAWLDLCTRNGIGWGAHGLVFV
jgi:hypothetical protein